MNVQVDLSDSNSHANADIANSTLETSVFENNKNGADALIKKIISENIGS